MGRRLFGMAILSLGIVFGLMLVAVRSPAGASPELLKVLDKKASASREAPSGSDAAGGKLDPSRIDAVLAAMSDEQVRSLLIEELRKSASAQKPSPEKLQGFSGVVQGFEDLTRTLEKRIGMIRSGARAIPTDIPRAFAGLEKKGQHYPLFLGLIYVVFLLLSGWGVEKLFRNRLAGLTRSLEDLPRATLGLKFRRLALLAVMDVLGLVVFSIVVIVLFFILFDDGGVRRLGLLAFLFFFWCMRGGVFVSRFVLAPRAPNLRLIPLRDESARSVHAWVARFITVMGTGMLVTTWWELRRASLAALLVVDALTGLVVLGMVLFLCVRHRGRIRDFFIRAFPRSGDRKDGASPPLATYWLVFVLPYILVCWALWVLYLLLDRVDEVLAIGALFLSVPLFLALNTAGQKLLDMAFGSPFPEEDGSLDMSDDRPSEASEDFQKAEGEEDAQGHEDRECSEDAQESSGGDLQRFIPVVRYGLSFSLAGGILFWLLGIWGFDVRVGEAVTGAAFQILVAMTFTYVAWKWIESAINRRLEEVREVGEESEDQEMGGAGGSRVGTLLQLLRKFMLVTLLIMMALIVLSALGVNIGPLMAGAGVVGLAVGFGTQTLVKDIVSGIFFLIDDAFRIGDYVDTGKVKGMVEHISIRSLRLRHHLGMVHTIPFSELSSVTNYSRDYIIMKLKFRVPYDTDIEKVRKIVKKINKAIEKDEEMGPRLLAPIKSQGVKELDDSAMIMRIKFKTIPGEQFVIRKEVYKRLQKAFEEAGIEFAHRHVIVQLPRDAGAGGENGGEEAPAVPLAKKGLPAGAAAALSDVLAEEAERKLEQEAEKG